MLELRRLLYALKDLRPDICIRFRLMGEMWQTNHLRLLQLSDSGAILNDESTNKLIFIQDLNNVMQFELDRSFQQYEPHFHYTIDRSLFF